MRIDEYKELMKNKKLINVAFSAARNQDKMFFAYDSDGNEIRLPYDDFFSNQSMDTIRRQVAGVIRTPRNVLITNVDEDNRIITVSYLGAIAVERMALKKSFNDRLDRGEVIRTQGVVVDVRGNATQSYAVVRIKDSNLKALLWCNRWSPAYVADLKEKATVGMVIDIDIIGYNKSHVDSRCTYICARDTTLGNVWEGVEKRYSRGDVVNVTCEHKWEGFYSGSIAGENELPIRMLPPQRQAGKAV